MGRFVDGLVEGVGAALPLNLVTRNFGGAFGMAWAVQHPAKVRRIVVINHPFFIADYRWHLWARIYRIVRYGSRRLTREATRRMYSALTPAWKHMVVRLYRAADPAAFREWAPRMLRLTERVPVLVLWGRHDPYIPPWVADRFAAQRVVHFPIPVTVRPQKFRIVLRWR